MTLTRLQQPPEGQLLNEASNLVSGVLGARQRFGSRSQFHQWLTSGGQSALVKAKAMKPLRYVDPYSSLEAIVGLLRLSGTRRPPETYGRRLKRLAAA